VEFITANALYIGLAVVSGLMLLWPVLTGSATDGGLNVSPAEAVLLMSRAKTLVLDVRDEAEFSAGHIQGAKHVPLADLEGRLKEFEKQKKKPVVVHCQRGVRSNQACKVLKNNGFEQVHQLNGGLDKWVEAKMPLVKA